MSEEVNMKLLVATRNKDKLKEIKQMFEGTDIDVVSISMYADMPEVIEDCDTLEGNARKKALETSKFTGLHTIADDTGLFVDALNGQPGVYSARFAGPECSYKDNRSKMLKEMENEASRSARFRTIAAFASSEKVIHITEGRVEGEITDEEVGEKGFGYDAIFRSTETGLTFGEMSDEAKNEISHRGRALKKMIPFIIDYFKKLEK